MTDPPATAASLAADLVRLGVTTGDTVMVHTSMRGLGYVVGGEAAVLDALRTAVGATGTLVMPTQSWQLCDPAFLREPHVPQSWWSTLREHLPAYDPRRTPTRTMGAVAELFRTQPGSSRSSHPHRSITANGPRATEIVARHDLDCPAGERSPLAALYAVGGTALLLGVGPDKLTCLHLAEHRARFPGRQLVANGGPVLVDGVRRWLTWEELQVEDDDFPDVVAAFEADGGRVRSGTVGQARAQLLPIRELVDFAAGWFSQHRPASLGSRR